jgi:hypothetical protein
MSFVMRSEADRDALKSRLLLRSLFDAFVADN